MYYYYIRVIIIQFVVCEWPAFHKIRHNFLNFFKFQFSTFEMQQKNNQSYQWPAMSGWHSGPMH